MFTIHFEVGAIIIILPILANKRLIEHHVPETILVLSAE